MQEILVLGLFGLAVFLAAGLFAGAAASEWRDADPDARVRYAVAGLIALVLAAVFACMRLGHPEMIFGVLARPGTGMFMEFVSFFILLAAMLIYIVAAKRDAEPGTMKKLAGAGLFCTALFTGSVGYSMMMAWRPATATVLIPLMYLGWTALAAAAGTDIVLKKSGSDPLSAKTWLLSSAAAAVLTAVYAVYVLAAASDSAALLAEEGVSIIAVIAVIVCLAASFVAGKAKLAGTAAYAPLCAAVLGTAFLHLLVFRLSLPVAQIFKIF